MEQNQAEYPALVRGILSTRIRNRRPMAFTHTYGCQGNVSDGEKINGMLESMGYVLTDDVAKADFILFNTCAVREHAEDRVFGNIGALKKYKTDNPDLIIAVCGCMVQQESVKDRLYKSFPYVDLVFGTFALPKFPELLYKTLCAGGRVYDTEGYPTVPVDEGIPKVRNSSIKAFLPIAYGCNNFCSYCIVPYVRGRERSRKFDEVIREANELVDSGYKEIMLLGQNVNSYGNDFGEKNLFSELLRTINDIPGDFIIRFMTSHPKDCTHELIDTVASCEKVEKHIHLPFQSGNDRVLRAMNRGYDSEHYTLLAEYAKNTIPDLCLTSDVIVGFPGETYDEFGDTLKLIRSVGFSSLYTFIYSKRPGTKAAELPDPVSSEEKSKRLSELISVQEETAAERNAKMLGKTYRVLAEEINKKGLISGRTSGNIIIEFPGDESLIGSFVNVKVNEALTWILKGQTV